MKKLLWPFLLLALAVPAMGQEEESPRYSGALAQALEKAAEYAERIKQVALHFYCIETVTENNFTYKIKSFKAQDGSPQTEVRVKKKKATTVNFDYQMLRDDKQMVENRMPIDEATAKQVTRISQPTSLLQNLAGPVDSSFSATGTTGKSTRLAGLRTQYLVYGPVSFLSRYWQDFFNYRLEGEETLGDRKAMVVAMTPTEPREQNYYQGRIWVDAEDFSILKIEYEPLSLKGLVREEEPLAPGFKRMVKCTIGYDVQKNGVRFPGSQFLRDYYLGPDGTEYPVTTSNIRYHDYRFFVVNTKVEEKEDKS